MRTGVRSVLAGGEFFFPVRIFFRMTRARYFAINYLPIYRDSPKQASPRDPRAASLLIMYLRPPFRSLTRSPSLSPSGTLALSIPFSLPLSSTSQSLGIHETRAHRRGTGRSIH